MRPDPIKSYLHYYGSFCEAVADPGFPRGGTLTPEGAPTHYLVNFPQKPHENEEILDRKGGGRIPCSNP